MMKKISPLKFFVFSFLILFFSTSSFPHNQIKIEKSKFPPLSPSWVFDHWMWEDDKNTADAVWEIVNKCKEHDIPVGAVIIDSPWATEYNNFVFNEKLYPQPQKFIDELHKQGIRVILWMTSMLNKTSSDLPEGTDKTYSEALTKGYFINNGELFKWWKGEGGFLDYTNPEAVNWWHNLMDRVLDMGIDGWKVDGVDALFPAVANGLQGKITKDEYKDLYYMDTYEYTISKNPWGITLVRSVDNILINPKGFSPISHSPATWVGDQKHNWGAEGFQEAVKNIFDAAKLGYAVIGSDIAGYHGNEEITKEFLLRWTQFGALCPLMENGGHGKRFPWQFDNETIKIYRYFVKLHHELKPYFYSLMVNSHFTGKPIIRVQKGKWQYTLGDYIFVSVIYENNNEKKVLFPSGSEWIDYWNNEKFYAGGSEVYYNVPLAQYPIFIKNGSIIPLFVVDDATGHGNIYSSDSITFEIFPSGKSEFTLYDECLDMNDCESTLKRTEIAVLEDSRNIEIHLKEANQSFILRIYSKTVPNGVKLNNSNLTPVCKDADVFDLEGRNICLEKLSMAGVGYFYSVFEKRIWIRFSAKGKDKGEDSILIY